MDELLIKQAQKGNKESFTKLMLEVKDQAYKIAYCYLHNEEDSVDAVCNAVEKAYKNIKGLRNPKYFKTWFIRIVINECKTELKIREKINNIKIELQNEQTFSNNTIQKYSIESLLSHIPETERSMIHMKYYMGYTLQEIAEILNIPVGTAKTKIYSNIKKLKSILNDKEGYCDF
ncbi:sigma-70 family RNA polymerase sigma factor [Sporosalibacterium faouarense]|uniref:sigma-70 family RNA polymerase sigma factor n=1 Tax=Sporosalibacterium faouarense TaxID=516123 RepID=UPI00192BF7B4|nr:sigma-70 family RNA polymerase sigma factor [Sporosalibacterium faouarense]